MSANAIRREDEAAVLDQTPTPRRADGRPGQLRWRPVAIDLIAGVVVDIEAAPRREARTHGAMPGELADRDGAGAAHLERHGMAPLRSGDSRDVEREADPLDVMADQDADRPRRGRLGVPGGAGRRRVDPRVYESTGGGQCDGEDESERDHDSAAKVSPTRNLPRTDGAIESLAGSGATDVATARPIPPITQRLASLRRATGTAAGRHGRRSSRRQSPRRGRGAFRHR